MNVTHSRSLSRRWSAKLGAFIAALALLLVASTSVFAATVKIDDQAHVLNSSQINSEASSLPYPINIYTVTNYTAGNSAFDQATANKRAGSNNLIVMAINTTPGHGHVRVDGGSGVPLKSSDYQNAASAFASNYNKGDYNGATIAAISSLRNALSSGSSGGGALPGSGGVGSFFGTSTLCCVGLLILIGIAFFVIIRRRNRSGAGAGFGGLGGLFNRNRNMPPPGYGPNYNQPYGQGPYNQPYPPNYGQNPGMNPWAAGGLGAAAGGLVGYELGKEQGENENRQEGNQGGDFGGGGGADFDNNSGGGGDSGGGADFGGSGDSGGGGGDFGGGGGSDF